MKWEVQDEQLIMRITASISNLLLVVNKILRKDNEKLLKIHGKNEKNVSVRAIFSLRDKKDDYHGN